MKITQHAWLGDDPLMALASSPLRDTGGRMVGAVVGMVGMTGCPCPKCSVTKQNCTTQLRLWLAKALRAFFPFARVKFDLGRTMLQWWKRAISQETGLETPG